ncbi:MAG: ADP-forming succinate--CoA ligase subunit beta [Chlamydiota bacterium]
MKVHEYQAKHLLSNYGIPVEDYGVASILQEVTEIIERLELAEAVIKVQIQAGGRGKAGGVKIARTGSEILQYAQQLLAMKIVNSQTGPQGLVAEKVLLAPVIDIAQEYYVGVVVDSESARPTLVISPEGGMDIEELALSYPERIMKVPFADDGQLKGYQLLNIANFMGWKDNIAQQGKEIIQALARAFVENDALMVEINPLIRTPEGTLCALDAKLEVDDNALYRQKMLASCYDPHQQHPLEARAHQQGLSYVALEGNIGCMVNGAGLAMATMDILAAYKGMPANFLDIGGNASVAKVAEGFRLLLADPKVEAIMVNIFGGIVDCSIVSEGIIEALQERSQKMPLVLRLAGTGVVKALQLFEDANIEFSAAESFEEAAQKVINILPTK